MAETVFSNLRTRGTLAVVGLATLATAVVTTIGITTANITTANVQTLSGSTIKNTAGTFVVDGTDVESTITYSGSVVRAIGGFTGSTLTVSDTSGSGAINVYGPDGGGVCFFDTDAAGWTVCSYLNGVQACSIAQAGYCPRS